MSQALRSDLCALGAVDHFSNDKPRITASMIGRQYRVVRSHVVCGEVHETPIDGRLFNSMHEARAAALALRIAETAA